MCATHSMVEDKSEPADIGLRPRLVSVPCGKVPAAPAAPASAGTLPFGEHRPAKSTRWSLGTWMRYLFTPEDSTGRVPDARPTRPHAPGGRLAGVVKTFFWIGMAIVLSILLAHLAGCSLPGPSGRHSASGPGPHPGSIIRF